MDQPQIEIIITCTFNYQYNQSLQWRETWALFASLNPLAISHFNWGKIEIHEITFNI
jgi:hypothetical protein